MRQKLTLAVQSFVTLRQTVAATSNNESRELNQDDLSSVRGAATHGGLVCPSVMSSDMKRKKLLADEPKLELKRKSRRPNQ